MAKIDFYTIPGCPFCTRARRLLETKNAAYTEYDCSIDAEARERMEEEALGYTYPQIIIDGTPIGGCDELHALERAGKLDAMIY